MLAQLVQCLQAESEALVAGDVHVLAQAVADKDRALRDLADGFERGDQAALREAVRSARDLNQRNARLLAAHMNVTRARIESLFGAARTGALYSSDGRSAVADGRPAQRGVRA
jgi:flagellar biosynthesis/type III secretory pathway chaperone